MTLQFYNENAKELARKYLSKSIEEVYQGWSKLLPSILKKTNTRIQDLGSGSGRDTRYLAKLAAKTHSDKNNIKVFAVEPAKELASIGRTATKNLNVKMVR